MNNFEKIKAMSPRELARFLDEITDHCHCRCCDECPMHISSSCSDFEIALWLEMKNDEET